MNTLIFSDVHLNVAEDGREKMAAFTSFLQEIDSRVIHRIIILGDLFDFWFEYRHVIFSGYFEVLRAFARLRDEGVEFHFVCGNHDFWAGRFLRDTLGFHIHFTPLRLTMGDKRVLFAHGDGINKRDIGYRVYKRIARFPLVVWIFGCLHPDWAMGLAQSVSRGSRRMFQAKDLSQGSEVIPIREFAIKALASGEADMIFCGHTHYPVVEEHPGPNGALGVYINTGDWLFHQSYVVWDGEAFELKEWRSPAADQVAKHSTQDAENPRD